MRVAWIIFDELDGRILLRPDAPYAYSNFNDLRQRSVDVRRARPPGGGTIRAMPSYWLGRRIESGRAADISLLQVQLEPGGEEISISELDTLYEEVSESGFTTGLMGFYHPYCRLFGESLDRCTTFYVSSLFTSSDSFLESFRSLSIGLYPNWLRRVYIAIFESGRDEALDLVADPDLDFVSLHFNLPHDPPIYDPESGEMQSVGIGLRYEGNVVLADLTLGLIEERIRAAGLGDRTALIVSADHGWKPFKGFDTEPGAVPLIIHLPGQQESLMIDEPIDSLLTRSLILALMRGEVGTSAEVASFLKETAIDDGAR